MEKVVSYTITVGSVANENNILNAYFEQGWRVKNVSTLLLNSDTKTIVVTANLTKAL